MLSIFRVGETLQQFLVASWSTAIWEQIWLWSAWLTKYYNFLIITFGRTCALASDHDRIFYVLQSRQNLRQSQFMLPTVAVIVRVDGFIALLVEMVCYKCLVRFQILWQFFPTFCLTRVGNNHIFDLEVIKSISNPSHRVADCRMELSEWKIIGHLNATPDRRFDALENDLELKHVCRVNCIECDNWNCDFALEIANLPCWLSDLLRFLGSFPCVRDIFC